MPWVEIRGYLKDHRDVVKPEGLEQRLWLKPNRGRISRPGALDNDRVFLSLNRTTGFFTGTVYSEPGSDLYYTLCSDWLPPQDTTEERARGFYEWPERIYPDIGGDLDDLVGNVVGAGLVYVSSAVGSSMSPIPRYQILYNPSTNDVFERVIEW